VTVEHPIYPSLWDATLAELGAETPLWEVFADAENFHARVTTQVQAEEAEKTVRRVLDEGWATLSLRTSAAPRDSHATDLSDDEAEDAIRRVRTWFVSERQPGQLVPKNLLPIFLNPSDQWIAWKQTRRSRRRPER
jgi:hypothetical protein